MSKPTVGAALRVLESGGLVREQGRTSGRRGPRAVLYEPRLSEPVVFAFEVRPTGRVQGALVDLEGSICDESEAQVLALDVEHVNRAVAEAYAELSPGCLELACCGGAAGVDPTTGAVLWSPSLPDLVGRSVTESFGAMLKLDIVADRDIYLAALGEAAARRGDGVDSLIYMSLDVEFDSALVLDGRVHRGRHGAAGRVGLMPVGEAFRLYVESADRPELRRFSQEVGAFGLTLDNILSEAAVERVARHIEPQFTGSAVAALRAGTLADPLAVRLGRSVGFWLAAAIATVAAIVDVELVVLNGSIATNSPVLLEPARTALSTLVPYPPTIAVSGLGNRATLIGAAVHGAELARDRMIRRAIAASNGIG